MVGLSNESLYGWRQLYLGLDAWAERIREAYQGGNRDRDELDYYMAFFGHSHALVDWMNREEALPREHLSEAIDGSVPMRICWDISNRFKHLTISRPKIDAHWSIVMEDDGKERNWVVLAGGHKYVLWDLMMECLSFWETLVAAYGLNYDVEYNPNYFWRPL